MRVFKPSTKYFYSYTVHLGVKFETYHGIWEKAFTFILLLTLLQSFHKIGVTFWNGQKKCKFLSLPILLQLLVHRTIYFFAKRFYVCNLHFHKSNEKFNIFLKHYICPLLICKSYLGSYEVPLNTGISGFWMKRKFKISELKNDVDRYAWHTKFTKKKVKHSITIDKLGFSTVNYIQFSNCKL